VHVHSRDLLRSHTDSNRIQPYNKYMHCQNCDMYYLYPKLNHQELDKFYKEEFEEFMHNRSGDDSNWEDAGKHSDISQRDAKRRDSNA